jgi:hypothetical protein
MGTETPLSGGNITSVSRIGSTVRRQPGPWTAAVHSLLDHLQQSGFDGSPRVLGFDPQGREILTYIEGLAGFISEQEIRPARIWSDQILVEAAALLKRFHDATAGFRASPPARWQMVFPDTDQHDVICHNDFAPYNLIFKEGHINGMIDFDTAGPGPRIWDVAYAAYRFVPFVPRDVLHTMGAPEDSDIGRRLKLFCDAYGPQQRQHLLDVIQDRIAATRTMLVDGAAAGIVGYQNIIKEGGHLEGLDRDMAFVEQNAVWLQTWIEL